MQYHQQTLCGPVLGDAAAMPHGDTQVSYGAGWAGCLLLHQPSGGLLRRRRLGVVQCHPGCTCLLVQSSWPFRRRCAAT